MKKYLIFIFLLFFFSCSNNTNENYDTVKSLNSLTIHKSTTIEHCANTLNSILLCKIEDFIDSCVYYNSKVSYIHSKVPLVLNIDISKIGSCLYVDIVEYPIYREKDLIGFLLYDSVVLAFNSNDLESVGFFIDTSNLLYDLPFNVETFENHYPPLPPGNNIERTYVFFEDLNALLVCNNHDIVNQIRMKYY